MAAAKAGVDWDAARVTAAMKVARVASVAEARNMWRGRRRQAR